MRAVVLLLLLVAAAETFFVFGPDRDRRAAATPPVAYQQAKADALFASSFKQFSSTRVALAQFKGKPLIVYFWATWCAECKEEAKALAALQRQHEAGGLAVIGVGVDQSDQLERFMRENQLGFPVFVAGKDTRVQTRQDQLTARYRNLPVKY